MNLIHKKFRVVHNFFQVTAPTAIFKGDADDLADVEDINRLVEIVHNLVTFENCDFQVSELPNVVLDHLVDIEGWTHTDYIG